MILRGLNRIPWGSTLPREEFLLVHYVLSLSTFNSWSKIDLNHRMIRHIPDRKKILIKLVRKKYLNQKDNKFRVGISFFTNEALLVYDDLLRRLSLLPRDKYSKLRM